MNQHHKKLSFSNNFYTLGIFLLFAVVYCLISLGNHYFFRTYGLDYGMFNQAVYQFSKLEQNYCTLCHITFNYFGDHFSLVTPFLIPFQLIFGSYGLLIAQILFVLFGAWGFYKYCLLRSNNNYSLSQIFLALFLSFTGVFTALAFDYHNNVLAAMMVPWIFYSLEIRKFKWVVFFWVIILFCKENMGLWMGFFMVGLLFVQNGKYRKEYKLNLIVLSMLSFIYFYVVTIHIMPLLQGSENMVGLIRYEELGGSFSNIIKNIISNPLKVVSFVFNDNVENAHFKKEFLVVSLAFGAWACVLRPAYFFMLIPLLAQKFLTNHVGFWGIYGHYYVEFGPIFIIAVFEFVLTSKMLVNNKTLIAFLLLSLGVFTTLLKTNISLNYNNAIHQAQIFSSRHYLSDIDVGLVKQAISNIPNGVSLSCSNQLAARLYKRGKLYLFPKVSDAEYVVILKKGNPYPLNADSFNTELRKIRENPSFYVSLENDEIVIFQKLKE